MASHSRSRIAVPTATFVAFVALISSAQADTLSFADGIISIDLGPATAQALIEASKTGSSLYASPVSEPSTYALLAGGPVCPEPFCAAATTAVKDQSP